MERISDSLRAPQDNQFDFHVSITSPTNAGRWEVYSGAILSPIWVLTTASRIIRYQRFDVRFGAITFYTGGFMLTSHVSQIHPDYNPINHQFDAGLILLPRVVSSQEAQWGRIAIPPPNQNSGGFDNQLARISGYGLIGGQQSPVLQYDNIRIIANNDQACRNVLSANNLPSNNRFMCAQRMFNNNQSTNCTGDVGSPIHITDSNRRPVLVGIAVFGAEQSSCSNATSIFVRLTDISVWIRRIVPNIQ